MTNNDKGWMLFTLVGFLKCELDSNFREKFCFCLCIHEIQHFNGNLFLSIFGMQQKFANKNEVGAESPTNPIG